MTDISYNWVEDYISNLRWNENLYGSKKLHHVVLLEIIHKKLITLQSIRYIKSIIWDSIYEYSLTLEKKDSASCYSFISTVRTDSVTNFNKLKRIYGVENEITLSKTIRIKNVVNTIKLISDTLSLRVRSNVPFLIALTICENMQRYKQLKLSMESCSRYGVAKLFVYSEHEKNTWLILNILKRSYTVCTYTYLHGFPIYNLNKYFLSQLYFKYSMLDEYHVPNENAVVRLKKIFEHYEQSMGKVSYSLSGFNIYKWKWQKYLKPECEIRKVVICLGNHRWHEFNKQLISLACVIKKKFLIEVYVRPHPSLSENRIRKYCRELPTCEELSSSNVYIMGSSTLFFDLNGEENNRILRFNHDRNKNFDDLGCEKNLFLNSDQIINYLTDILELRKVNSA
jgi:hypothetical protein